MAPVQEDPLKNDPFVKRSASQSVHHRLQTLRNRVERTSSASKDEIKPPALRPKANTLAGNVASRIRNAFQRKRIVERKVSRPNDYTPRKVSRPNDYTPVGGQSHPLAKRGPDYVTIDWNAPKKEWEDPLDKKKRKKVQRKSQKDKIPKAKDKKKLTRAASITHKTISYRGGPTTKRLKVNNLRVKTTNAKKPQEVEKVGKEQCSVRKEVKKPKEEEHSEENGPEAKFKVVSSKDYEYKVYPKELYPVVPVSKKMHAADGEKRLRFQLLPTNVESGGPNWNAKVREIMMTEPEGRQNSVLEPLYLECEHTATLTACTEGERLAPPTSLPLSLLRRSVDSAYFDEYSPADVDHQPSMIFTNKKSTNSADNTPQSPFARPSGHRASTSSSSMSSVDIDAHSPVGPESMTITPPPRKKERAVKKQNLGNSIKNFIKPTIDQRAHQFHKIFKGMVSKEENFVASYSCAFQREILAQGRLYLSDKSVAFAANIFGWETKHVIRFGDVANIKRAKTAKIFPNSIEIETKDGQKHFFASFANREKSYVLMYRLWQLIVTDVPLSPLTCSDIDKLLPPVSELDHPAVGGDDVGGANCRTTAMLFNPPSMDEAPTPDVSLPDTEFPQQSLEHDDDASDSSDDEVGQATHIIHVNQILTISNRFIVFAQHPTLTVEVERITTNCTCKHEGKLYLDDVYDLSVESMRSILFGGTPWFHRFASFLRGHAVHSKIIENISAYSQTPPREDLDGSRKMACTSTYQLMVNHSMIQKNISVNETLELTPLFSKASQGFRIFKETKNQGVPYADYFTVKTTYCVTRIAKNQCRLKVHGLLNFIKTPWGPIKGYMEKSTDAGLAERYRALDYCLIEDLKSTLESTSSITSRIVTDTEAASTDDEEDEDSRKDRTLTKAVILDNIAVESTVNLASPSHPKSSSMRRDLSTFSTNTMVANPRATIVESLSNFSPSIEFYLKVVIVLLFSIVLLQLMQLWSASRTGCGFGDELGHLAAQLRNPEFAELLRAHRVQEVRRSVGQLSEQLTDLMTLMRVSDET
uniref:VASt domain-containing protein n=1 Tax=Steinernema glaseri TaxID=37863 RepID=A0A1I7YP45_9BILA